MTSMGDRRAERDRHERTWDERESGGSGGSGTRAWQRHGNSTDGMERNGGGGFAHSSSGDYNGYGFGGESGGYAPWVTLGPATVCRRGTAGVAVRDGKQALTKKALDAFYPSGIIHVAAFL